MARADDRHASGAPLGAFRYELRSAEQLQQLASSALPLGMQATAAQRSMHRDLYLDTDDDALRRRGVTCRFRIGAGEPPRLSLFVISDGAPPVRLDAVARDGDFARAVSEDNVATRRLRALVDPTCLVTKLDLEVFRLTRTAHPDLLRRPRLALHYDEITVRRSGAVHTFHQLCGHHVRGSATELQRLAGALEVEHDLRAITSDRREHAELLVRWMHLGGRRPKVQESDQAHRIIAPVNGGPAEMLNAELSLLAFQRRVLALAQDPATPLRERFRFIAIVTSNLDELFMVRMPDLRRAAADDMDDASPPSDDGLTPTERLARVEAEVSDIIASQSRCAADCLRAARAIGVRLVSWAELDDAAREALSHRAREEIMPGLSPLAMTLSPGHPLPHLPHLGLSLAVVFRRTPTGKAHLAEIELPGDITRLLPVPGHPGAVIAIEEVLRANIDALHPNAFVESTHLFRVTRAGDLALDEDEADDLLHAVASATERRPLNPAVRVEVERSMPDFVSELVLENLRREAFGIGVGEPVSRVEVVDGLIDLRCLTGLPIPRGGAHEFPPFEGRAPSFDGTMLDAIRERDLLVHHPFDAFDATVARFLGDAAADPDVTTIKITLYRVGYPSPIANALIAAAQAGKRVVALVELKARFDEEQNVGWARALEKAGGHVIYGLVGLKVHAKAALVVRREGDRLRRYAHVGTGNYSARSGREYTDLSLFSARDALASDVSDLFNELTGSSRPPQGLANGALVAPHQLLPSLLALIERETMHARAGRPAAITIKVNGLSDPDIVRALYRAAQAGVRVDMVVRGICTLRPGVPGRSTGIRIVSVVGRFLEHSRIYRFANGGEPVHYIGSSDLRPRNLRRRVELLVPVLDAAHRATLDRALDLYLADPTGWWLDPDGAYRRPPVFGVGVQARLAAEHSESGALTG